MEQKNKQLLALDTAIQECIHTKQLPINEAKTGVMNLYYTILEGGGKEEIGAPVPQELLSVRMALKDCLEEESIPITQVLEQIQASFRRVNKLLEKIEPPAKKLKKRKKHNNKDMKVAMVVLEPTLKKILEKEKSPDELQLMKLHNEIIAYRVSQSLKRVNADNQIKKDLLELYTGLVADDRGDDEVRLQGGGVILKGIWANKELQMVRDSLVSCFNKRVPVNRIIEQINTSLAIDISIATSESPVSYFGKKYSALTIARREGGYTPQEIDNDLSTIIHTLQERYPDMDMQQKLEGLQREVMQRGFVEDNDPDDADFVLLKKILYLHWRETIKNTSN